MHIRTFPHFDPATVSQKYLVHDCRSYISCHGKDRRERPQRASPLHGPEDCAGWFLLYLNILIDVLKRGKQPGIIPFRKDVNWNFTKVHIASVLWTSRNVNARSGSWGSFWWLMARLSSGTSPSRSRRRSPRTSRLTSLERSLRAPGCLYANCSGLTL